MWAENRVTQRMLAGQGVTPPLGLAVLAGAVSAGVIGLAAISLGHVPALLILLLCLGMILLAAPPLVLLGSAHHARREAQGEHFALLLVADAAPALLVAGLVLGALGRLRIWLAMLAGLVIAALPLLLGALCPLALPAVDVGLKALLCLLLAGDGAVIVLLAAVIGVDAALARRDVLASGRGLALASLTATLLAALFAAAMLTVFVCAALTPFPCRDVGALRPLTLAAALLPVVIWLARQWLDAAASHLDGESVGMGGVTGRITDV
ncbi:MAG: hypothetical protein JW910_09450 [Anaerolineae bacterium]|nr:hypothetical protein [Anaerolineae bacterium]